MDQNEDYSPNEETFIKFATWIIAGAAGWLILLGLLWVTIKVGEMIWA